MSSVPRPRPYIAGWAPTAHTTDSDQYIGQLELHMHRHGAAARSVGVLHGVVGGFPDRDEQIGYRSRGRADCRQPATHRNTDIPQ